MLRWWEICDPTSISKLEHAEKHIPILCWYFIMFDELSDQLFRWLFLVALTVDHDNLLHDQSKCIVFHILMKRSNIGSNELNFLVNRELNSSSYLSLR